MGQSGIPMINKTGYSMFWNSMWDNKITYSRLLKEDIFLNIFFSLSFNDSLSANTISFKDKKLKFYKSYEHNVNFKKSSIYKHMFNLSKINYYSSKLWVLRYQHWTILYHFLYIPNSNKDKNYFISKDYEFYGDSFFYLYKFYTKIGMNTKNKYTINKSIFYSF